MVHSSRQSNRLKFTRANPFTINRKRLGVLRKPFTRRANSRVDFDAVSGRALQPVPAPRVLSPVLAKPVEDAFVDYSRLLTLDGGILMAYKDYDIRWRHTIWRIFAWCAATGYDAWFIHNHSPVAAWWLNAFGLIIVALINFLIVIKQVELYRSVEIKPDGMIVDGTDVFWLRLIEGNWPTLQQHPQYAERYTLSGTYGTRFVEYTTSHRMDERDRTPEVLGTHLADAMMKLWGGAMAGQGQSGYDSDGYRQVY